MEFEITDGVPIPRRRGKPRKYDIPLEDMVAGDHIHIALPKTKIATEIKIIRNFVLRYRHKNPSEEFTVRQLHDGVGIWRT
jgi:ribosomal protein L19